MLKLIKEKISSGMGKDIVWTFSIQIAIMLCSFAITKVLSTRLSVEDFGQYNVIKRSVQVLSFVMLAGVGIALPRYIPLYRKGEEPRSISPLLAASLTYIAGITLTVCLLCQGFSNEMQRLILGRGDSTLLFLIAQAYAFILAMAQFTYAYYRGIGDFKWYNGTQLCIQLAIILPLVLLPQLTATNVFASWLLITAFLVLASWTRELWLKHQSSLSGNKQTSTSPTSRIADELRIIVKYSFGRLLADFFLFSITAFPLIYISNTQGLPPTAYYSVGITFVTMVTPLFSFMGIILLPYVSECIARHEMAKASRLVNQLTSFYLLASVLFIAFLFLFTEHLTRILFAENYVAASSTTRIMIFSILPQAIYLLFRNPIDAVSLVPYNTINLGICLVTMIIAFNLCATLPQFAWSYLGVSCLQGSLSFLTWHLIKNNFTKH